MGAGYESIKMRRNVFNKMPNQKIMSIIAPKEEIMSVFIEPASDFSDSAWVSCNVAAKYDPKWEYVLDPALIAEHLH